MHIMPRSKGLARIDSSMWNSWAWNLNTWLLWNPQRQRCYNYKRLSLSADELEEELDRLSTLDLLKPIR